VDTHKRCCAVAGRLQGEEPVFVAVCSVLIVGDKGVGVFMLDTVDKLEWFDKFCYLGDITDM